MRVKILWVFLCFAILVACGEEQPVAPGLIDWENRDHERAEQVVNALVIGEYASVAENFDSNMQKALSVKDLKETWEETVEPAGAFIEIVGAEQLPHEEYDIYLITSRHHSMGIVTRVVFDMEGLVAGLFFRYTDMYEVHGDLSSQEGDGFTETPVVVGEGTDYPLNGRLSVPRDFDAPFPAVVLVHGSGPLDMDETAYGIKVFKDIAEYLAVEGIAVLRYDKRTFAHGVKLSEEYGENLTVWEETITDALLAKELLTRREDIDPSKIYVLGHSLGGMLAPRIVSEGGFAGGVIMAGSPRGLLDIMRDQADYLYELMDISEAERQALYAQSEAAWEEASGSVYFQEMDAYPAEFYLDDSSTPFLIMQGGKDFQVFAGVDFALYQQMAEGRGHIELRLYPNLTHLFTRSTMENPNTDDYIPGSKVDAEPLADIVRWLKER